MANSKYAAFIAAAEEGNMTAAAQKLGYTQSGVSQLMAGGGVALVGLLLVPLLTGLFG